MRLPNSASASSKKRIAPLRSRVVEELREVLLGLADVLAHDARQVDPKQLQPQLAREHLGGHGLAGARFAGEERGEATAERDAPAKTPVLEHAAPVAHPRRGEIELVEQLLRQDQVVARVGLRKALRDRSHAGGADGAAGAGQRLKVELHAAPRLRSATARRTARARVPGRKS